ncbi:MAG: 3-deoxy-manno-octulosonate cytidylyltransferase [Proteobacteria bacterium]|nr:3-deoxy-manno-octulosonate cytidylyltransferase [Pseudomonadota bacterium]
MRVTAIIPARYGSTRFPGKPLVTLAGVPMVVRVARRVEQARAAGVVDELLVATDDSRIARVVREAGFSARMTSPDHPTGTDRLAEVAADRPEAEIVCNVQGDEPLIEPDAIAALVAPLREDPELQMGTLKAALEDDRDRFDPNRAKLAVDARERALTFTRQPIFDALPPGQTYFNREAVERQHSLRPLAVYLHIGIYAYRREFLLGYSSLERTPFERSERLEQLRALENGYPISAPTVRHRALPVDTPEDAERVEAVLRAEGG